MVFCTFTCVTQGDFKLYHCHPQYNHWMENSIWSYSYCLLKINTGMAFRFYITWAHFIEHQFSSVQFSHSVVSDSLRPMNRSTPGLPVHHQLPELTQTHAHRVGDAIQPSHPLSSPSPVPNPSQHQGLFQWVSSSHEVAKVFEFQLQHQSFPWTPRTNLL